MYHKVMTFNNWTKLGCRIVDISASPAFRGRCLSRMSTCIGARTDVNFASPSSVRVPLAVSRTSRRALFKGRPTCVAGLSNFDTCGRGYSQEASHLPAQARVVICGGGVIGCSVAYHLAQLGWTDVVVLEQGSLSCGTTWHSVGLVGQLRNTKAEGDICSYGAKLYKQLDEEGYGTGWKACGSLNLARTKDRLIAYTRALTNSRPLHGEILTPGEIKEMCPYLRTDDLEGGVWIPSDGTVAPSDLCMAFSKKAKEAGVKFIEGCQVQSVNVKNKHVEGVKTNFGDIQCEYFVNCGGQWARELGQKSHPVVKVPLHSCEHFYVVTKALEGVPHMMPVVRDYDGFHYLREWSGGIMAGGFEPNAKPCFHDKIPDKFEFQLLPEDWDHFQVLLEQMLHRMPSMQYAEVKTMVNGPESFTPDGKYLLGPSSEVWNYFVAAGMNSSGVAGSAGVGRVMADWIINGEPSSDVWSMDVRRFADSYNNKRFLRDRVVETVGMHSVASSHKEFGTSRKLLTTPLYLRHAEQGAFFGQQVGLERALWFMKDEDEYELKTNLEYSFGKPRWFDNMKAEYWACREGVCLIDMSTFSKFVLRSRGTEVVDFLQYLCSNEIDQPIGSIIHTGMQNHRGGYENDCSVVRLSENAFFMIGPTAQQTRSFAWLRRHLPADGSVQLSDVTSMYTAINVIGPKAQELLSELTDVSLSTSDFPFMTCKEIDVGQASGIKAMRLTHTGEDGWMLYIPSEYALHVYDSLMAEGQNYGVQNAGYYALRALRIEKFFAYWGTELTPYTTPLECGRETRVKFDRGGFIGCEALQKQKKEGIKKRLTHFLLEDHNTNEDIWPWGGEPIYRNGKYSGSVTSTGYGFTLDHHICLGFVADYNEKTGEPQIINSDFILKNATYEIDIAGKRYPAKAAIYPPPLASAAIVIDSKSVAS